MAFESEFEDGVADAWLVVVSERETGGRGTSSTACDCALLAALSYREREHVGRADLDPVVLLRQRDDVIDRDSVAAGRQRRGRRERQRVAGRIVCDRTGHRRAALA